MADALTETVVIKLGTGVLTCPESGHLDADQFERLTEAVAGVQRSGVRCVLVSSGAVGAGLKAFGLEDRPEETVMLQACAAAGQSRLMHLYESLFRQFELDVAQLLVTNADFCTPNRRENFRETLARVLDFPTVVPIINENDSVATEELRFGDNDALSAGVAQLAGAGSLIMLTSVEGLSKPDGTLIEQVADVADVAHLVREGTGRLSVGGMRTKLEAVERATTAGIETVIADGRNVGQLTELISGGGRCTRFIAKAAPHSPSSSPSP